MSRSSPAPMLRSSIRTTPVRTTSSVAMAQRPPRSCGCRSWLVTGKTLCMSDTSQPQVEPAELVNAPAQQDGRGDRESVEQPAKVMRIGSMIKQLLDEVRAAPLDEASRDRLA